VTALDTGALLPRLYARDAMRLELPPIDEDGVRVERFEISEAESRLAGLRAMIGSGGGRGRIPAGWYTRVFIDGALWMSDSPDEVHDHAAPFHEAQRRGGRVLINGLGAGLILGGLLKLPNVEHIDVVEIDERIIRLIGPHYADPRVRIHHADAHEIRWPAGTRWNVVWHDIWLDLTAENLPSMHRLHRRYGSRADWQASWGRSFLEAQRSRWS
jgi:hypothetical protein